MSKKVLIVGGVAGGATAATRLRRLDENAEIIMFERDEYISFANCGLPYYIGGTIKDRKKLIVNTPEAIKARFNIDVRNNSEVLSIDPQNKKVTVSNKLKGTYEESYDYLILSPGGKAIKPDIPGINSGKIFSLRNIPDTDAIKAYVDQQGINSAVVIGGGFIGVEMAENLKDRGMTVTLVEAAPHILAPFDSDMAVLAEKELVENGIELLLGEVVTAFEDVGSQGRLTFNSGAQISADLVILAIGVTPNTAFLKDSGLEFGPRGHIIVNEKMETNLAGIYAAGDAIEVVDYITGQKTAVALAGPANKQARVAADNVAGLHSTYKGTQGTSALKVYGLTAASTGANEKTLQRANMPYKVIYDHPGSHASYYPGAKPMSLKLIFGEDGRVLGAQIMGYDGVDKRIDVLAAAIRLKATVDDLAELELAYGPPYSSAKDPVNMAGFIAQNVLSGKTHVITGKELEDYRTEEYLLLDVRTVEEFENGHLEGAQNIPLDSIRDRLNELDKNKTFLTYCKIGIRGYTAERILSQHGFKALNITGGYITTKMQHYKPQKPAFGDGGGSTGGPAANTAALDTPAAETSEKKPAAWDKELDARGLSCPGPLLQVKAYMDELTDGQVLKVTASDPGFYEDVQAWCKRTFNELLDLSKAAGNITALIRKKPKNEMAAQDTPASPAKDNKTIIVFSGELDKAFAAFIIANGAAAMGKKVTMFFTFWGLNILRKTEKVAVKKGFIDSMFGMMMPRGTDKLKISNMNMLGMGTTMMKKVMKDKNINTLEELIKSGIAGGIEMVACQMSMDVMGIHLEELIDGVKTGGVVYMLSEAEDSNVNLFI